MSMARNRGGGLVTGMARRRGLPGCLAVVVALLPACGPAKPPDYRDESGLHFAPPPGWVERARPAAASGPGGAAPSRREPNLPLPHLDARRHERLLVRYDRLTAGRLAWLRLSVAAVPASTALEQYLATRAPGSDWRREAGVETLEVKGRPAARGAWKGRWIRQDYLCETTAVRRGEEVYLFTASFPAADPMAREQVRQAVANATLP
jgi:hypothetical protein